jgi:farnesol dehydrogenase
MANILVTGGTGFIGVHLVKRLNQLGHKLKVLIRDNSNIKPFENFNNIAYVKGDVTDIDSLYSSVNGVDLIYHLAAYTKMWARDKTVFEKVNVNGTENIIKVASEKNLRLVYLSSFIALGATPTEPVDETFESEDGLYLDYAKTKLEAKKIIKEYIEKGLNITIFYPGIVYGPGDFNVFGQIIYDITRKKFLGCPGKGENVGNFVYVEDVIDGLVSIIDRNDLKGEGFILGGINIKFTDWINLIAEIAGSKKPRHFPMSIGLLYAKLCEYKTKLTKKMPYTNCSTVKMIDCNWSYSSKKAIEKIGYHITPLREGLKQTIKWYKDYIEKEKK